jgi:ATP-dependent Lhr-like helicase
MSPLELLDPAVASAFYGGFSTLREQQKAAIEPLMAGLNMVLSSGTGSGKTEAVMAPLISRYRRAAQESDLPTILYVAPTKALVNDLEKRLQLPLHSLGLRLGIRHGDRDDLTRAQLPHVLITTPESLEVLHFRKDKALKGIRAMVIDEVHLLFNTQRGLQLAVLLSRTQQETQASIQWVALSATIGELSEIRDFLVGQDERAVFLAFPSDRPIDAHVRRIATEQEFRQIISLLTKSDQTKLLVFVNSRKECERLTGWLQGIDQLRDSVFAHYSSLSQNVRLETERRFAEQENAVCVATSTLELGVDIGDIDAVVLWGVPGGVDSFLQRIGRGNRRSIKTNVICLVPDTSVDIVLDGLRFGALLDAGRKGELSSKQPQELYGAIAQQCLSIIASNGGRFTRISDLSNMFANQSHIDRKAVELILSELATNEYLQPHGFKNQYGGAEKLYELVDYRLIYGNFALGSQTVNVSYETKQLGEVPAINLIRVKAGETLRFAGKSWLIRKVSKEGFSLIPSSSDRETTYFIYPSAGIRTDAFVTNRIWNLLHAKEYAGDIYEPKLRNIIDASRAQMQSICSADQIPYVKSRDGYKYYTFAGHLANRAIGLIAQKPGYQTDDISVSTLTPIEWANIPKNPIDYHTVYSDLFESGSEQTIYQRMLPLDLQTKEYLQGWLKDRMISQVLARLSGSESKAVPTGMSLKIGH